MDSNPAVSVVKFGDCYEQQFSAGLNNSLKKYNVTIRVSRDEAHTVEDFLSWHGRRVIVFMDTAVLRVTNQGGRKWSVGWDLTKAIFTATFEQMVL
ncbi:phage tail protein [Salmonella enterica]|nr:phage tail protein [Salmonella enterica]EGC6171638.1 phage tail protein [Salmonella enterica]EIF0470866.1 phage tail protein [Salmonella enterica]EJY0498417.1 phage tail protein [Salmonella enterica]EKM5284471.1 phage tail protein [Salmonella enterica]